MVRTLSLFLYIASCLVSQDFHSTYRADRECAVQEFSVVEWNPKNRVFSRREDLPTIPKAFRGRVNYQFDGQHLYMVETPGNTMRILYGFSMVTPGGPQWFMRPPVDLKGDLKFLGASNLHAIVQQRLRPEGTKPGKYLIQRLDLTTEKLDTLLEEDFRIDLQAIGAVKDHAHVLFLTDGRILEVDETFGGLKVVASRFWQGQSDKWVDFVERQDGQKLPQPPVFPGNPFFSRDGDICVPMLIRETNVWTRPMLEAVWAESPAEDRERAIKQGLWPPKSEEFFGSDYVLAMLRYHPETHKTTVIPVEDYESLIERTPYVKQARLAKALPNPLFLQEMGGVAEVRQFLELVAQPKEAAPRVAKP